MTVELETCSSRQPEVGQGENLCGGRERERERERCCRIWHSFVWSVNTFEREQGQEVIGRRDGVHFRAGGRWLCAGGGGHQPSAEHRGAEDQRGQDHDPRLVQAARRHRRERRPVSTPPLLGSCLGFRIYRSDHCLADDVTSIGLGFSWCKAPGQFPC
jgi:hypothetical protein